MNEPARERPAPLERLHASFHEQHAEGATSDGEHGQVDGDGKGLGGHVRMIIVTLTNSRGSSTFIVRSTIKE